MYQEEMEPLLVKHCSNLHQLSVKQLQAIKEEKDSIVTELAAQKQIIVDGMVALQTQFDINSWQLETRDKVKKLLDQIAMNESESQRIVKERCTDLSRQMLANRREMNIQQAYEEESSFQVQGNLCNIEK